MKKLRTAAFVAYYVYIFFDVEGYYYSKPSLMRLQFVRIEICLKNDKLLFAAEHIF
jgi:hypothetical protein